MQLEPVRFTFEGQIRTDFTGFRQLLRFYTELSTHYQRIVYVDFGLLDWFDANLSAVLCAYMHKLQKDNDLTFIVDQAQIAASQFEILHRNGCFLPAGQPVADYRQSTILCTRFSLDQTAEFKQYIANDLFEHRGLAELKKLNHNIAKLIRTNLIEIFENYRSHAHTEEPFFVCGQYFPQQERVSFTMTDLGVGFLPPIYDFSNAEIQTDIDAIHWALSGGSTRQENGEPSGCGLSGIKQFCQVTSSDFQIVTGRAFWGTDLLSTAFNGSRGFKESFVGCTVNISFNTLVKL